MAYIWNQYKEDKYYYIPEKGSAYYFETWREDGKNVPVNINQRFSRIFYPEDMVEKGWVKTAAKRYREMGKFRDIANICFHFLAQTDRISGITLEDIRMSIIYQDIKNGLYGDYLKEHIDGLEFADLYIILKERVKYELADSKVSLFDEALYFLFGKVIIYKESSSDKTMVYIELQKNEYRKQVFEIVKFLFADRNLAIECFWKNEHFGIIGRESTMKIGQISIYAEGKEGKNG